MTAGPWGRFLWALDGCRVVRTRGCLASCCRLARLTRWRLAAGGWRLRAGVAPARARERPGLLREAAEAGDVRTDIAPEEMADYCLHALTAAGATQTKAAIDRLVQLTLAGLEPTT
jgi:hypothetical protein